MRVVGLLKSALLHLLLYVLSALQSVALHFLVNSLLSLISGLEETWRLLEDNSVGLLASQVKTQYALAFLIAS